LRESRRDGRRRKACTETAADFPARKEEICDFDVHHPESIGMDIIKNPYRWVGISIKEEVLSRLAENLFYGEKIFLLKTDELMSRFRADALLLLAALIWGGGFIAQKFGNAHMPPIMFGGVRFGLATLAMLPFVRHEARRHKKPVAKKDWRLALLIGLVLFIAVSMQQVAMMTATATNGGFITSIYVVLVPFAAWAIQGAKPRMPVVLACILCLAGAWLLAGNGAGESWAFGDKLLFVTDFVWAIQIVLISKFLAHTHRPFFLSVMQYAVASLLSLIIGLAAEPVTLEGIQQALPAILYGGLISASIAYTLQVVAQRHTPAAEAALIMSLENVFAALAGALMLGERLTFLAAIGCVLIVGGIVMAEIGPLLRSRKIPAGKPH
jgi:drug/metabolite transporter (DMT)-like permease